ncbi:MAG: prolyl oligopeptidase family serine peptidase [Patescibacteria group bacterium]
MGRTVFVLGLVVSIITLYLFVQKQKVISPIGEKPAIIKEKPLDKYTFENLKKQQFKGSTIALGRTLEDGDKFTSQMFYYKVSGKKVSGLLNVPKSSGEYPVIVMLRGFVPKENYTTGIGTKRAGEMFATNGFIALAPDFLGYGESDKPSKNPMEERFQTYTTVVTLLSSLVNLNRGLDASYSGKIKADTLKVGIWGHSNGGQIALSVLEISGKNYPTVLWAPVSKPFPYSILYYTDEFDDRGKALRKVLANFEKDYDVELYSLTNYFDWINAPMQIHQGENDDAVPKKWSDELVDSLSKLKKEVEYFTYPDGDHNLMPNGWSQAVERSIEFYREKFSK